MRPGAVRHMAWAKRHQLQHPVRLDLSTSAVAYASLEDLGGLPRRFPLVADNSYGHPAIVARLARRYGVGEERVLPVNGASLGNFLVAAACLARGARAVLEWPVYEPLRRIVEAMEAEIVFVRRRPEDGWAMDPGALARACGRRAALVVLTNLHNPSGTALDDATVRAAARAAGRAGATLLVDEVYLDAAFRLPRPPAAAATLAANAVSTSSWTKAYGLGGIRSGWIVAPPGLIRRIKGLRDLVDVANPLPADLLSLRAWGRRRQLLARSRRRFEENWPVVAAWLSRHPEWRCTPPAGGFVCFPRAPDGVPVARLLRRLLDRHGCAVTPGAFFGAPRHVRIGFGGDRRVLEEGLAALSETAREFSR